MKLLYIMLFFGLIQNTTDNTIYEGRKGIGQRVYISNIDSSIMIVEYGGTSMKIGGNYFVIYKQDIKKKNIHIIAMSNDEKTFLYKKNNCLYLSIGKNDDRKEFKLYKKTYDEEINRIRFNIFKMFFYDKYGGNYNSKENLEDFEQFKQNPNTFLKLK